MRYIITSLDILQLLLTTLTPNKLNYLADQINQTSLKGLFDTEDNRVSKLSKQIGGLTIDFSKQLISNEVLQELISVAKDKNIHHVITNLNTAIEAKAALPIENVDKLADLTPEYFSILRRQSQKTSSKDDVINLDSAKNSFNIALEDMVASVQPRLANLSVINVGMGGSSLGPELLNQALLHLDPTAQSKSTKPKMTSISNLDDIFIASQLAEINLNNFVIVLQSKSFQTDEIFKLFQMIKHTLIQQGVKIDHILANTYAVTAQPAKAREFGIFADRILSIPNWLSGRYSIWSNMCFPICLVEGMDTYYKFLQGARIMDEHFFNSPLEQNFPVIGALIDYWNQQYLGINHRIVLPYSARLNLLINYLAQLETESLGKSIDTNGKSLKVMTGQFVWGALGTEYQHSIGQMLHQGTNTFQAEFIGILDSNQQLLVNLIAQSQTLMHGHDSADINKRIVGNRPSTCILLSTLNEENLGALISYYEHKVYVLSQLLGIDAFDQWGVERAKDIAKLMKHQLTAGGDFSSLPGFVLDSSTKFLLKKVLTKE